jgi:transposase
MQVTRVGIDISKSTFNTAFRDANGLWQDGKFSNNSTGFQALIALTGKDCAFMMEATGLYHVKLALFLHGEGIWVNVSNPLMVKRFCQMQFRRTKTDHADARMIAEFAVFNASTLKPWRPTDAKLAEAQALQTAMRLLVGQCTAKAHCIEALRLTDAGRTAALALTKILRSERKQIRALDAMIEKLVRAAYEEEYECARSIPSIGPKTAAAVILATGGLANFNNSRQLSAYFGMSPRQYQSGTSVHGKVHICKMGDPHIRALLYMCSVSSLRLNKPCKAFYDSLVVQGKPKKVALMAVANKLLRVLFAVMKTKTRWSLEVTATI